MSRRISLLGRVLSWYAVTRPEALALSCRIDGCQSAYRLAAARLNLAAAILLNATTEFLSRCGECVDQTSAEKAVTPRTTGVDIRHQVAMGQVNAGVHHTNLDALSLVDGV